MEELINKQFNIIDLFAGCGGLSEGFQQIGFTPVAQVEMDKRACETLRTRQLFYLLSEKNKQEYYNHYIKGEERKKNLYNKYPDVEKIIKNRVIECTIEQKNLNNILKRINDSIIYNKINNINIILGGPPCQPYSLAGRSRDPDRMENDGRHFLYRHYLKLMQLYKPDFFVYENVPGLFSARSKGEQVFKKLLNDFSSIKPEYKITPPLEKVVLNPNSYILNSMNYRVPEKRKRLILIGYKKKLAKIYPSIDNIFLDIQLRGKLHNIPLTVRDAISDLPALKPGKGNDGWFGDYNSNENLSVYQKLMRKNSPGVINHKARTHMESDLKRYKFFIDQSDMGNFNANLKDLKENKPELLPNHKHLNKFIDRFKVQCWNKPSSTITAHISKDGHYYIHPDIKQCRSFTVREAARCQSFPDNYKFEGPRTEQFKQVGNAVPPLLAKSIAIEIYNKLKLIYG